MPDNDLDGSRRKDAICDRMEHVEGDRLSSLPDDLIYKILSFICMKDAIGTSVLSSRWRFIWTSMPYLNFENLNHRPHFSKFVSNVLSHRNNRTQVSSVKLILGRTVKDDEPVRRILDYAFCHNVQQLTVTRSSGNMVGLPRSLTVTPTWDLPALTTLHLHHIKLSDDNDMSNGKCIGLFSKCTNLKNLFLRKCALKGTKVLNICHPRLSNLTLEFTPLNRELKEVVNVVAPQLKNLTIKWCKGKHLISAPGLTSLVLEGFHHWQLSTPGFHSLEKVDLSRYNPCDADPHNFNIVCLLLQLRSVKLLTLNLGILERLSSSKELIPHQACAFANAKIIKFITNTRTIVYLEVPAQEKITSFTEIKNYDSSPSVIFPMVSREEIKAMGDMASAQMYVKHLRVLLKQCNANTNSDTKEAHREQWAWKLQWNLGEMMALIKHKKFVALETCPIVTQIN